MDGSDYLFDFKSKSTARNTNNYSSTGSNYSTATVLNNNDDNTANLSANPFADKFNSDNDKHGAVDTDFEYITDKYNIDLRKTDKDGIRKMINKEKYDLSYDMDGDGVLDSTDIASAIANSYDSVLDLYIQKEVEYCIEHFGGFTDDDDFLSEESLKYLESKHIRVNDVAGGEHHVWAFSLVDDNGNIMQDADGNLGSCIFSDELTPDGFVDQAEMNFPLILDEMGYDCITKADFNGTDEEYEAMLNEIEAGVNSGLYKGYNQSIWSVYNKEAGEISRLYVRKHHNDSEESEEDENNAGHSKAELQRIYNAKLESKIKEYKFKNGKDNLTQSELSIIEAQLSVSLYREYSDECSFEDIKAIQESAHKNISTINSNANAKVEENQQHTTNTIKIGEKELV